jgi:predicted ATP-dependent endonuclease of OLD family
MILSGIKIQKLFSQFDYDIVFNHKEGITILTGPNGYGKTTILNILWSFFNQDFTYIIRLPFEKIAFQMEDEKTITVTRQHIEGIRTTIDGAIRVTADSRKGAVNTFALRIELASKGVVLETVVVDGEKILENQASISNILEGIKVHLIKDQRLTKNGIPTANGLFKYDGSIKHDGKPVEVNTVSDNAKNMIVLISQKQTKERDLAQQLDNSFPKRLINYTNPLPKEVFEKRFQELIKKQQQLQAFGIYPGSLEKTEYEGENQRVLSVYFEDYEKKTGVYDELLEKINLFVELLNQKHLANKQIAINSQQGYYFSTNDGQPLELTALSAGEQQEIILLYELLFKSLPGTLVLIDEPETSLHVAWQQLFLQDLMAIASVNQLSFLVATHSPDIINDKMDLSIDLYALAHGEQDDNK